MRALGEEAWRQFLAVGRPLTTETLRSLSPMLILAPHADDETLGCGGLISIASELRLRPRVAYLTDGAASHPGSRTWPRPRLAAERRIEALEALKVLGVPEADVRFLGWPDAAPFEPMDLAYRESQLKLADMIRRAGVRSLWAPWPREAHGDHVAAAGLARTVAKVAHVRLMNYLVWGWEQPELTAVVRPSEIWTLDCPRTVARRRRALSCHRTQTTGLITDAEESFRIPPRLAALTERPAEVFLEARAHR